ncbi:hypothetical protein RFM41_33285 [Mesorhizobium sp. VK25A]|uniref:Uncharacterized protein n=1 Tax=Mesorhizobium vachelliae TaxID=3072309 RepID=A0ABU5AF01_9HYPH|nr:MULTISPECIES: hypothetical protein [unclassified Mesorhizobium]MDX8535864.1 hypothetical protein [Mesorhizobium sp. VK25D]MDX8548618.1 hypothetical protein [Mesorhizobium sp. VK25A]
MTTSTAGSVSHVLVSGPRLSGRVDLGLPDAPVAGQIQPLRNDQQLAGRAQ